jgi:hypothetical protein
MQLAGGEGGGGGMVDGVQGDGVGLAEDLGVGLALDELAGVDVAGVDGGDLQKASRSSPSTARTGCIARAVRARRPLRPWTR